MNRTGAKIGPVSCPPQPHSNLQSVSIPFFTLCFLFATSGSDLEMRAQGKQHQGQSTWPWHRKNQKTWNSMTWPYLREITFILCRILLWFLLEQTLCVFPPQDWCVTVGDWDFFSRRVPGQILFGFTDQWWTLLPSEEERLSPPNSLFHYFR